MLILYFAPAKSRRTRKTEIQIEKQQWRKERESGVEEPDLMVSSVPQIICKTLKMSMKGKFNNLKDKFKIS